MKKIKTEITGGELVKEDQESIWASPLFFSSLEKGETSAKEQEITYEGTLQVPFKVIQKSVLAPVLDKKGKPKKGHKAKSSRITSLWIELPFDVHGGTGTVKFHAYGYSDKSLDEKELGNVILKALGNEIFSYKLPDRRND